MDMELPDDLPESLRQAIQAQDSAAFQAALEALPETDRAAAIARLQDAGILSRGPDMDHALGEFDLLLRGIATVARGDERPRAGVAAVLPRLAEGGWQITAAVQRIWAGERDGELLTAGIDANSALLVRRILELIAAPEELAEAGSTSPPPQRERGAGDKETPIPAPVQAALISNDPAALLAALEALPAEERARIEALLEETTKQAIERARRRSPEEIIAGLPAAVRAALEQQDEDAFLAAMVALPKDVRQRAQADLIDLQALSLLADQEELQRDPRERFDSLLRGVARVAVGDDRPRAEMIEALAQLEQAGWQLRGPAERIWAGERDRDALVAGLDDQDTLLVERVLELIAAPEELTSAAAASPPPQPEPGEAATQAHIADLPAPVRTAIQQRDARELQLALAKLPPAESRAILERLQQADIIGAGQPPVRPDIEQVIQNFMPLLGDIALAAFGDAAARQLAEAVLPQLEQSGWRLSDAIGQIWAGERNSELLVAGIDPNSAALLRQLLHMLEQGPETIMVAQSIELTQERQRAEQITAQVLAGGDAAQRAGLARQLEDAAGLAAQQPSQPWQELAAHMQALATQLQEA